MGEHHSSARTSQGSRGRQALRSCRNSPLPCQALRQGQGTQVRESQRQEAVQRIQEVECPSVSLSLCVDCLTTYFQSTNTKSSKIKSFRKKKKKKKNFQKKKKKKKKKKS